MSTAAPQVDPDAPSGSAAAAEERAAPERTSGWSLLWATLARQRVALGAAVGVGLVWTAAKVTIPQLTKAAIDRAIARDGSLATWTAIIASAGVVTGLFTATRRYLAFRESRLTETLMREELHAHVQRLHARFHDLAQTGQLMSRASSDLNQVQQFVVMIPITLSNVAQILAVAVVLFISDPVLAAVALLPLPFINVASRRFTRRIHSAVMQVQAEQAQLAAVVEESVSGIRVIKGFGAERVQYDKLAREAEDIRTVSLRAARIRSGFLPAIDLLPSAGLVAVLGLGGHRVLAGRLSVGDLVAFNVYLTMLVWPLRNIGMLVALGQRAAAALERVREVLDTVPAIASPAVPRALPRPGVGAPVGRVELARVRFGYDPTRPVLRDVSLVVEPGTSLAIVGATASGKSTIVRLLLRFYDVDSGHVRLDGIDVRHLDLAELRRAVGVVFEETLLFHDTVRANVAFAVPDAPDDVVERAARLAGAHDFIVGLPQGYDTVVGERGYSLSGGQRQRIAIARAIVADPRVLVLDDATSAVDPTKELEIREAMRTVMTGRTTIVIAHRPATVALADRIALLDGGVIADVGTHDELVSRSERYREVLAASAAPDGSDASDATDAAGVG